MNCAICGIRKPKRQCPGVNGQICAICCGREREESVDCPITCDYLREAHKHERALPVDPAAFPNQDIRIPESFLEENEWLLVLLGSAIVEGALLTPGATDFDIREGLESLIATWRSLQAGLIYEARPANRCAADIRDSVQTRVAEIRTRMAAETEKDTLIATPPLRLPDGIVLAVLICLQRIEYSHNNGRKRSRAVLDFLMQFHVPGLRPEETVEPEAPLVIL